LYAAHTLQDLDTKNNLPLFQLKKRGKREKTLLATKNHSYTFDTLDSQWFD